MIQCRLCDSSSVNTLINFGGQPIVHNLLDKASATCQTYPFELATCQTCGFVQIQNPIDPKILYENYFTVSAWKNQPHVTRLIDVMSAVSGMRTSTKVLDIGCNDGSFLSVLRDLGFTELQGIEPTNDASKHAIAKGLKIYHDFFGAETAPKYFEKGSIDLVVTRQVLEHISNLNDFMQGINHVLSHTGQLVIEIPDSEWHLDYIDYTLWEEHVNYFTINTLRQLLAKHDFEIIHFESTLFSGKALMAFCQRINSPSNKPKFEN